MSSSQFDEVNNDLQLKNNNNDDALFLSFFLKTQCYIFDLLKR